MTFGQRIKKLRNEAGLTQKELADKINVSFQTVSKWESDLNEPDINNIKQLAKVFGCSVELLFDEAEAEPEAEQEESEQEEKRVEPEPEVLEPEKEEPVLSQIDPNTELEKEHEKKFRRCGSKKKLLVWSLVAGTLSLGISLTSFILNYDIFGLLWTILGPLLIGYAIAADVFCIFSDTWISDLFETVASWSIRFPGIIFSFDWDGLKFLIAMKLLFWVVGLMISIGTFSLAVGLSALFSIFAFPYFVAKKD